MASSKNTARNKRKYGDKRATATARNKKSKLATAARHEEKKQQRTRDLVGRRVEVRIEGTKAVGTVREVLSKPQAAKRPGQYLLVDTKDGQVVKARSRVRPVR